MSPVIFFVLLFIGLLGENDKNAFAQSLLHSKPKHCDCFSDSEQLDCTCRGETNDTVTIYSKPPDEIKIICDGNKTSKEWYKSLKGIDRAGDFDQMIIQKCAIPEISIKDLLSQMSVGKIRMLTIDYTFDPQNTYQAYHFAGLDFVKDLNFRNNRISSLPEDVFIGLSNLTHLFLNSNHLQRIPTNFFAAVPKITFLDLAENKLTQLEADTFKPLSKLRTLNLNGNKLTNLSKELFIPLRNLTRLDLSNNGITTFNKDLFENLSMLQELNLNFNNISVLPEGVFSSLKSLKSFRAMHSFNRSRATIGGELFSGLDALQQIIIIGNNFTHLSETIFRGKTWLKTVLLNQNRLTELAPTLFRTSTSLEKIDLSINKLTSLSADVFRGLQNLSELHIQGNEIAFIHKNAFDDLKSLRHLNLKNNRLSHLEDGVFDHLPRLRYIYLENNRLDMSSSTSYGDSILQNCLQLQEVHLRNNSVNYIFQDWQFLLTNLELLDLSHNKLTTLKLRDVQFLQSGVHSMRVTLDDNNIELVDLWNYEHMVEEIICQDPPCRYNDRDLKMSLRNNPINCDCKNYDFIRLIQGRMSSGALNYVHIEGKEELKCIHPEEISNITLTNVHLRDLYCSTTCPKNCTCRLRAIDKVTVVNCTHVDEIPTWLPNGTNIELIVAHNNLENLRKISPLMGLNITKLSLSWNALTNIDDLNVPRTLKVLELDHNQIPTLSKRTVETLNRTRAHISLHSNPWKCDCNSKYFLKFLKYRFSEFLIPEINNITCVENGLAIIHLSEDDLCSTSLYLYIICLTLAVAGVLFGVLTIFYLWYEHEIKVFMFAHKICLWLVTEKEVDRDKEFDAFISYAHQDEEFVVRHLIPNLENGPHPYKLCLHYRNWIVGDLIPEQIARSVASSRRTVIVLSRNYLESKWANLEFRTAHLQAVTERHARVLVILLEELDNEKLDSELKAYITMNTYLKWGDTSFWEKLRYALPHPQQQKKLKIKRKAKVIDEKSRRKLMEAFKLNDDAGIRINAV